MMNDMPTWIALCRAIEKYLSRNSRAFLRSTSSTTVEHTLPLCLSKCLFLETTSGVHRSLQNSQQ